MLLDVLAFPSQWSSVIVPLSVDMSSFSTTFASGVLSGGECSLASGVIGFDR